MVYQRCRNSKPLFADLENDGLSYRINGEFVDFDVNMSSETASKIDRTPSINSSGSWSAVCEILGEWHDRKLTVVKSERCEQPLVRLRQTSCKHNMCSCLRRVSVT